MAEKATLAAEVHKDGELYEDFQEYQESFESRSEAVRAALRNTMWDDEDSEPDTEREPPYVAELMALAVFGIWIALGGAVPWASGIATEVALVFISIGSFGAIGCALAAAVLLRRPDAADAVVSKLGSRKNTAKERV